MTHIQETGPRVIAVATTHDDVVRQHEAVLHHCGEVRKASKALLRGIVDPQDVAVSLDAWVDELIAKFYVPVLEDN
jgi:hypothetical protein